MTHPTDTLPAARDLAAGYAQCARITRRNGTTYVWGARLLPRQRRRHVHAIYALCRVADDIVDDAGATLGDVTATAAALADFRARVDQALAGRPDDDLLAAVAHTAHTCRIAPSAFDRFFAAMAADLTVTRYETWADLRGYMDGSAAVIGEMMLPVLGTTTAAAEPARALGEAFQLTNFLRDVGEDLDRGRIYLPQEDLRRFGADPSSRRVDDAWRALMRFQIERNRQLYARAWEGLAWLPSSSARCVATAHVLYSQILERIEAHDYDVFTARARVATWRKASLAARSAVLGPPRDRSGAQPGRWDR